MGATHCYAIDYRRAVMGADFGACRLIFGEADGFPGLTVPPEDDGRLIITENDIRYEIDYKTGQKTGFYLDQKYNRASVACIAKGRRVLDCFTHTGAFALNAAAAGAVSVTAVDISEDAIALARKNAELNGLSNKINFVRADVFDYLTELAKSRGAYDLIILDPPAFAKSSSTVKNAQRGYREINRLAMKILPRGGFLRHARAHIS